MRRPSAPRSVPRWRACLSQLLTTLITLLFIAGAVALLGYGLWRHLVNRPSMNVLILGIDRRPEQGDVVRSDTLMVLRADPGAPQLALLSIPRDLYVDVPGYGSNRINTAHFWGENEAQGRGPALAMETVTQNFRVPVQHYVRVDFDAFRTIVDTVGGLEITVEQPVVDHAYPTEDYGTIAIEIPAGRQHMDGETALRYARSRHGSSDFDRAARQQEIIVALAHKLLEPRTWPMLPAVYQVIQAHTDTDLAFGDFLSLGLTLYRVGPSDIDRQVIDRDMTSPWTTPTGGAVLLPDWNRIHPQVDAFLTP
jgi:LCP family protein required for cell wall assembly